MALCQEIVRSAFRRSGVAAAGVALNSTQTGVGIERLQGMYLQMINGSVFGRFHNFFLNTGPYTAREWDKVYLEDPTSVVTIPATVVDRSTGKTRQPRDGSAIIVVNPANNVPQIWIYNSILGKWQNVYNLGMQDVAPLSLEFEEELKNILAVYIASENGLPIDAVLAKAAGLGKLAIASRYSTERRQERAEYY